MFLTKIDLAVPGDKRSEKERYLYTEENYCRNDLFDCDSCGPSDSSIRWNAVIDETQRGNQSSFAYP